MLSITELLLLLTTVSLVSIVSVRFYMPENKTQSGHAGHEQAQPIIIQTPAQRGDDRYTRAPRPQRMWDNGQEIPVRGAMGGSPAATMLLDPIPTRGAPEQYQQMGVMVGPDGKPLPLYGRRTAPRSDKFNYYTRTDSYNPVAMPVTFKNKDCQDNAGCSELSSGDSIRISPTGESAKVTLYGFDGPRYSPDI
jgi:hypothetical protein